MQQPVRFSGALPDACDVVVIGGGIIGVMTAWALARAGLRVVICEKGRVAGEQSGRNWGWLRQQGRDPAELPIMMQSLGLWRGLAARFGDALGFHQSGVLYLANRPKDLARYEAFMPHARTHGLDTVLLTRAQVAARLGVEHHWLGGQFTASDARVEPMATMRLLSDAAGQDGAVIREGCAVRGLDLAAGRVAGVVTEAGRIACGHVVLAGGAWSALFARAHGIDLPQLSVLASVAVTEPMPEFYAGQASDAHLGFRRRADGGYTLGPGAEHDFFVGPDAFRHALPYLPVLRQDWKTTHFRAVAPKGFPDAWRTPRHWALDRPGPFEAMRILNPVPNMGSLSRVQDRFAAAFPAMGRPRLRATWAGMIDTMPDMLPVVDHAPIPGLTLATGMSAHGFGIGPGIGQVVADLVLGRPHGHDLHAFRLARFTGRSKNAAAAAI